MELNWADGYEVYVRIENGAAVISANREGLLSLANHLNNLQMKFRAATSTWMYLTVWRRALRN